MNYLIYPYIIERIKTGGWLWSIKVHNAFLIAKARSLDLGNYMVKGKKVLKDKYGEELGTQWLNIKISIRCQFFEYFYT